MPYAEEAIAARKTGRWNLAQYWLTTETLPRARQATEFLSTMSDNQNQQMQTDARRVLLISDAAVVILLGLIASLGLAAYVLSKRGAAQITKPIQALSQADFAWMRTCSYLCIRHDL